MPNTTYKSTWQTRQEEKLTKLTTYPSATEVQRETRTAVFTVTSTGVSDPSSGGDTLVLGKIGGSKHRVMSHLARIFLSGTAWAGGSTVTWSLRRAPVTVGVNAETLGSVVVNTALTFTPATAQQTEGGPDYIYYLVCTAIGGSPAANVTYTIELPYYFEGI